MMTVVFDKITSMLSSTLVGAHFITHTVTITFNKVISNGTLSISTHFTNLLGESMSFRFVVCFPLIRTMIGLIQCIIGVNCACNNDVYARI